MAAVVLRLPDHLRADLKDPRGPIYTDAEALLAHAGSPVVAVGDVVTHHLEAAGRRPDVALVDGRTKRSPAEGPMTALAESGDVTVENPPGTLTCGLLRAVREAIDADRPVRIVVDGEEDLAAIPALAILPTGGSVVYGQPDAGMVLVPGDAEIRTWARAFLQTMEGDAERALAILEG